MADVLVLSQGDGLTSGYIDLLDTSGVKLIGDLFAPPVPEPVTLQSRREITLQLTVVGATVAAMQAKLGAIEMMLRRARNAFADGGTFVTLGAQLNGADAMRYADVVDGLLDVTAFRPNQKRAWATLTLLCLPYWREDAVTLSVSGTITNTNGTLATVGNSGSGGMFIPDIPGTAPALLQVKAIDVSTNSAVLNRMRLGVHAREEMSNGDLDVWLDQTSNSPGTNTTTSSNRVGSNYAEITVSGAWQDVADFAGGSPATTNKGEYDLWVRCRSGTALSRPTDLAGVRTNQSLSIDTYILKVTSLDAGGSETDASDQTTVTITGSSNNGIGLTWTVNGTASDHRVYFKRGSQSWKYFATGSASGAYSLTTESGATTGDPPSTSEIAEPYIRCLCGTASLTTTRETPAVQVQSGGAWVWVYAGREKLPPIPTAEGAADQLWKITVQGIAGVTDSAVTLDVDALVLLPPQPQVVAEYRGLGLATKREWLFDTSRTGVTSCLLRSTSDQSEQGWADVTGSLYLYPGDNALVLMADVAAGVADVVDAKCTFTVRYVPRWQYLEDV